MDENTKRELQKAYATLLQVNEYFTFQTQMNAKLHLSQPLPSPMAASVRTAVTAMSKVINDLERV